jgi:hypothetical protein
MDDEKLLGPLLGDSNRLIQELSLVRTQTIYLALLVTWDLLRFAADDSTFVQWLNKILKQSEFSLPCSLISPNPNIWTARIHLIGIV